MRYLDGNQAITIGTAIVFNAIASTELRGTQVTVRNGTSSVVSLP